MLFVSADIPLLPGQDGHNGGLHPSRPRCYLHCMRVCACGPRYPSNLALVGPIQEQHLSHSPARNQDARHNGERCIQQPIVLWYPASL